MKHQSLIGALSLLLTCGVAVPACAGSFDFSYIGSYSTTITGNFTTTTETVTVGRGKHKHPTTKNFVTAISGTFNGSQITALLAPGAFPFTPSNDNRYFSTGTPFDSSGIAFADAAGQDANLYFDANYGPSVLYGPFDCGSYLTSSGTLTIDPANSPSPVPEPGSLLLLGTAVAGLGLLARRRAG